MKNHNALIVGALLGLALAACLPTDRLAETAIETAWASPEDCDAWEVVVYDLDAACSPWEVPGTGPELQGPCTLPDGWMPVAPVQGGSEFASVARVFATRCAD